MGRIVGAGTATRRGSKHKKKIGKSLRRHCRKKEEYFFISFISFFTRLDIGGPPPYTRFSRVHKTIFVI